MHWKLSASLRRGHKPPFWRDSVMWRRKVLVTAADPVCASNVASTLVTCGFLKSKSFESHSFPQFSTAGIAQMARWQLDSYASHLELSITFWIN